MAMLFFFAALIGGLFFAALPGINMVTLGAIILPFTIYLEPTYAIMIYGVIYVSGTYGGAVMAILFNIPGSAENAPTAFDGYPLTQQGKSGLAIGAAIVSSSLGGIFSTLVMMLAAPIVGRWAIHAFGPPEMFALIFFGLNVAASVGADTFWKGWLSVLAGLLLACVGTDPAGGLPRFNFGTYYLLAGIHFIPLILGFFAISEVFVQAEKMVTFKYKAPRVGLKFPSFKDFWGMKICIVRSWILGFFAGVLPGIGATLAAFLSYNEAKRWSKSPGGCHYCHDDQRFYDPRHGTGAAYYGTGPRTGLGALCSDVCGQRVDFCPGLHRDKNHSQSIEDSFPNPVPDHFYPVHYRQLRPS